MKNCIFINLEKENIKGNVLDVGFTNYGIVYPLFKEGEDEISVDYVEGKDEYEKIEKNFYDSCVVFFSLGEIWSKHKRKKIIYDLTKYIKNDGIFYLWDVDKNWGKICYKKIEVTLPSKQSKQVIIKDYNIFKSRSFCNGKKLIEKYFEIIDYKYSDNIYCIKGKKRGSFE